jgi:FkbM family methyltransferase
MLTRSNYIDSPHAAENELLKLFGRNYSLTILDIGACEGEDSIRLSKLFPNSSVFTFEPLPSNLERIRKHFSEYGIRNATICPYALSDKDGEAAFNISSGSPEGSKNDETWDYGNKSSSLLKPSDQLKEKYPWLKFEETISITTKTIHSFCQENNLALIDFVHMDVQGAELLALQGANSIIHNIKAIYLEVEAISLYKDQPLKHEIERFMAAKKFKKIKDTVGKVSGDQLYINTRFFESDKTAPINKAAKCVKNIFSKATKKKDAGKISFSQCGEDLIVDFIFSSMGLTNITYMDIGAHHPFYLSNTALFYKRGNRGINIEPDPSLFSKFLSSRKDDINLNIGVATEASILDFYVMSSQAMNTFSLKDAESLVSDNKFFIKEIKKIMVSPIEDILRDHWPEQNFPDFLSLDVEGLDEEILHSIDFEKHKPIVICIETISFSNTGRGKKNDGIIDFLEDKGYMLYADTYINSIFVLRNHWVK